MIRPPFSADLIGRLSPRQRQCLRLVAALKGSKEIAAELGVSPKTVDGYLTDAIRLLGARDRRDAAVALARFERLNAPGQSPGESAGVDQTAVDPAFPVLQPSDAANDFVGVQEPGPATMPNLDLPPMASQPLPRARGWKPDDLTPPVRLILILATTLIIAVTLAATVNLIDALVRLTAIATRS